MNIHAALPHYLVICRQDFFLLFYAHKSSAGFTCWGPWANNMIGALPLPFPFQRGSGVSSHKKLFEILDAYK